MLPDGPVEIFPVRSVDDSAHTLDILGRLFFDDFEDVVDGNNTDKSEFIVYYRDCQITVSGEQVGYFLLVVVYMSYDRVVMHQFGYFETADFFATPGLSVYSIPQTEVTVEGYENITLEELLAEKEYDKVYVMLGMNELGYRFPQTVERYRIFIEDLQDQEPCAQLILCANLHVTNTRSNNDKFFNNENIDKINEEIRILAEEKELVYLNINELFDNEDGELDKEYASDDSHVTVENYIRWCDWIVEKMNE